ncbi:MAG: hypothetical protein IJP44_11450 [Bacteroidales bacterium]|nr:hypothetical protein [Bacteroidales bacterium]
MDTELVIEANWFRKQKSNNQNKKKMDSKVIWIDFIEMLPVILCGCVLPIVFIWLETRRKINESKDRMQIVTTAIEKHPEMDVEELMKKISPKKKSLKEKLLSKLLWGSICAFLGISLLGIGAFLDYKGGMSPYDLQQIYVASTILIGVGIAFLINYYVGKRMLAKEIEAEQNNLTKQA